MGSMKASFLVMMLLWGAHTQGSDLSPLVLADEPHFSQSLGVPWFANIYKMKLRPGQKTRLLRQDHDYVVVMLGTATLTDERQGEQPTSQDLDKHQVLYVAGGFVHVIKNTGPESAKAVIVDLLAPTRPSQKPDLEVQGAKLLFNERSALVYSLHLEPHAGLHINRHRQLILVALGNDNFGGNGVRSGIPAHAGHSIWSPAGELNFPATHKHAADFVVLEAD